MPDRPDIYQASYLAFQLKSKKTPIQNLHHLPCPDWSDLSLKLSSASSNSTKPPPTVSSSTSAPAPTSSGFSSPRAAPVVETVTSVQPRSRPKGAVAKNSLALPLQAASLSGKQSEGQAQTGGAVSANIPTTNGKSAANTNIPSASNPFVCDNFPVSGPTSLGAGL